MSTQHNDKTVVPGSKPATGPLARQASREARIVALRAIVDARWAHAAELAAQRGIRHPSIAIALQSASDAITELALLVGTYTD
jgi:hypothetical protein